MGKRKADHNKGYSLVEMIIVIAIIALVSGLSLVSVTLIHSAKAKDAALTFDSEVAALIARTKSQTAVDPTVPTTAGDEFAIKVYKDGDKFYAAQGVVKTDGTFVADTDNIVSLSAYVVVKYTGKNQAGTTFADEEIGDGDDSVILRYNKRGICIDGVGTFSFYKRNGSIVANVYVRKNGSHESK